MKSLQSYIENHSKFSITGVPYNRFCFGSSHGWLVTVAIDSSVALLNPFLLPVDDEIQLPWLQKLLPDPAYGIVPCWFYVGKVVVSVNPTTDEDYSVMVICGDDSKLAFWKPGDTHWNAIQTEWLTVDDVIFYGHQFFSVDILGEVMACDVSDPKHQKFKNIRAPPDAERWKKYVVESLGYLFLVHRHVLYVHYGVCPSCTDKFRVLKMDCLIEKWDKEEGLEPKWIEVNTLDDRVFFIGHNASISRPAAGFAGIKPSCIYFTDDDKKSYTINYRLTVPYDSGVFC